jgi:tetratricopeptide (TPR) repeat protein
MKIQFRILSLLRNRRSGFRQKAGGFVFMKYGGRPTAATMAILLIAGKISAADATADFAVANRLYAEGKFGEAASAYEKLRQTGVQSSALLFNYGNAEFKSGHLGNAIAAYRQAALRSPRDAEVNANLAFVRNQVQGATLRESHWQYWLGQLTLNEWTLLTATAFWLTLLLLAGQQLRPALGPKLKSATSLFGIVTILSGAALALQVVNHFYEQTAVVVSPEATARSGPFDEAQRAFAAHDGAELAVRDRHGDWIQVADGSGKIGWLQTKQVVILPGA